ncbi:hypothetical protein CIB95_09795 [Lottiidibacillus patelloidae]|uniref:Uncharacterized protein n=1 Tax=Lottiidibacillus patelloidae TaxID=2670334 RepID=A0A263BTL1_9BACI|nr:hypothetical protein [Lottiidibacillus patelloidae]OZM57050.1 hypothetical protein CIB95_09795 [Lottiidibacillus patelloidae]
MKKEIRHKEYVERLKELRQKEYIEHEHDPINLRSIKRGEGLTSPTTNLSTEETRILMDYIEQQNLFKITSRSPMLKKSLTLKMFFKKKRNQQVEVFSKVGDISLYTEGKVSAVGRDFVMLTSINKQVWIPFREIDSANIPYGIPNYANTYQHFYYDNNLKGKLLRSFGETVTKRETLMQQFNEDTLRTSLSRWKKTWVKVQLAPEEVHSGKIVSVSKENITLANYKKKMTIKIADVSYIETLSILQVFTIWLKNQ